MLQGAVSGGQRSTIDVDNAPGFTQGIRGPTLIERSVWEAVASGARCQPSILSRPQTVVASCAGVMLVAKTQTPPQVITPLAHGAVALTASVTLSPLVHTYTPFPRVGLMLAHARPTARASAPRGRPCATEQW